jgi:hypothetical protein
MNVENKLLVSGHWLLVAGLMILDIENSRNQCLFRLWNISVGTRLR